MKVLLVGLHILRRHYLLALLLLIINIDFQVLRYGSRLTVLYRFKLRLPRILRHYIFAGQLE